MGVRGTFTTIWLAQRGHLFEWSPVLLGCGIGQYFSLKIEPPLWAYTWLAVVLLAGVVLALRLSPLAAPVVWGFVLVGLGFGLASTRAHLVGDPVLGWRYYGPVQGRVVGMDRSASDALRVVLDQVVLANTDPRKTPGRVRVAIHGEGGIDLQPGDTLILTAHLSPPSGPVEPAGFDFQRHAWFQGLGAVGYTRTPVLRWAPPAGGQWVFRARMWLSDRVQTRLPGETGAFAAAIMAGDRSGIGQDTLKALRVSNLAHLLAISGLHMGLLAGFVFAAFRLVFAAVPWIGLRWPAKKLSAGLALIVAAGYLALSGGNVATERAFIMVGVMLCAVMVDRRALSLRAVAIAALIVLTLRPEALLGPGFQMSFAATTALVAVFGFLRDRGTYAIPRWLKGAGAVVLSSFVAGLATAPIAAAHFNQISHFGLIANLLSVPLMGLLVIPAAVMAACLLPFGLDWLPLWAMGLGLDWILGVAHWVSGLEGARGTVHSPDPWVLPLIALGALFIVLCQTRLRWVGLVPLALAFVLWAQTERPVALIADTGGLVGVMTEDGRALSRGRGSGFIALNWLENDGDAATQEEAFLRWEGREPFIPIRAVHGKRAVAEVAGCEGARWVVLSVEPESPVLEMECDVFTPKTLHQTGAIAIYDTPQGPQIKTARQITGARLWNTRKDSQ